MGNRKARRKSGHSLEQLQAKHAQLEAAIAQERDMPHPDDLKISELKRRKLRCKERIEQLLRSAVNAPSAPVSEPEAEIVQLPVRASALSVEHVSSRECTQTVAA